MSDGSTVTAGELPPPLRVSLHSMSERTRTLLEFHFDHDLQREFVVAASTDTADVVIVDHDYPGSRAAFEDGKWRDGPPLIVLAHGPVALDDALVLAKPLDRSSLDAAVARLRESPPGVRPAGLVRGEPVSGQAPGADVSPGPRLEPSVEPRPEPPAEPRPESPLEPSPEPSPEPPLIELASRRRVLDVPDRTSVASVPRTERARTRVAALCGPPRTLGELAALDDPEHRYDPARHLSGHLARAMDLFETPDREVRGLMLSLPGIELYVLPWLDRICTSEPLTWNVGVERAFGQLDDGEGEVVPYSGQTINLLVTRVNDRACQAYPIVAFRWLAALFSARGRLPFAVDIEQPLRLARWPNLSRLEMTPECMRIVAGWTAGPCSIAGMVEDLDCEPRYVTALQAASTAVGLLRPADPTTSGADDGA